jgi:hypothetical protein
VQKLLDIIFVRKFVALAGGGLEHPKAEKHEHQQEKGTARCRFNHVGLPSTNLTSLNFINDYDGPVRDVSFAGTSRLDSSLINRP